MNFLNSLTRKQIITLIIIAISVIGIGIGVYLVQIQHIFKSKATEDLIQAFELYQTLEDGQTKQAECVADTCTVESLDLTLTVKDIEKLTEGE